MAHLTPDELRSWNEGRLDHERPRMLAHLAACSACAIQLAQLARELETDSNADAAHVDAFRDAGYRLGPASAEATSIDWRRLAVAAVVLLAVGGGVYISGRPTRVERGSSSAVVMRSPVGEVPAGDAIRFAWDGIEGPVRLVVVDVTSGSVPLVDRLITGAATELSAEERSRFERGKTYHWFLEYRDAAGTQQSTPTARFSLPH